MEGKWKVMKLALVESATKIFGKVKGSQPDWFRESEEVISPYIKVAVYCQHTYFNVLQ